MAPTQLTEGCSKVIALLLSFSKTFAMSELFRKAHPLECALLTARVGRSRFLPADASGDNGATVGRGRQIPTRPLSPPPSGLRAAAFRGSAGAVPPG